MNAHIKQISSERKHGVRKDEKKRRSQYRIKCLIALLWWVHSGGEPESARKKQREQTNVRVFCCSGLFYFGSDLIASRTGVAADQT